MARTRTRTSVSLSESAVEALSDEANKSLIVNQMLEQLALERNSLVIINQYLGRINYKDIISKGVEAVKTDALRYKQYQEHSLVEEADTKLPRGTYIRNNIDKASTWAELSDLLLADGYNLDDLTANNFNSYANHPYYYQSTLAERATSGQYYVNKVGVITAA